MRTVHIEPPTELGTRDGLAYALFRPERDAGGGVVMLHGAGSQKENQFDVARALRAAGVAAICFDQRGHGESDGALGAGALEDVATMTALLAPGPVALRGSSMGGFMALMASTRMDVAGVVAICPATGEILARGLRAGRFSFRADHDGLDALLSGADEPAAAAALGERLLLMHAEGDESVPISVSRDLHAAAPASRLIAVPGGHHRSIQHDPELTAVAVRFLTRALRPRPATA
jgi:pimeloyl-ACP methyl ester carboxylesterase